jgi:hypothetical protein
MKDWGEKLFLVVQDSDAMDEFHLQPSMIWLA